MSEKLQAIFKQDESVWDSCADSYEISIVGGHPTVVAYENFEEDLLDCILQHLLNRHQGAVQLIDVGCGSARLHVRLGRKLLACAQGTTTSTLDRLVRDHVVKITGIDFSHQMIEIARKKLSHLGLSELPQLQLQQGSAFDLEAISDGPLPLAVTLCNTIGVMQGEEGARLLFQSMRRAVEESGGIAFVSAYRKDAVAEYALGNYESTMDVCGQPLWLGPDTYSDPTRYSLKPKYYKLARDPEEDILVDVYDTADGSLVEGDVRLSRIPKIVSDTISTGEIRSSSDYTSRWYSTEDFSNWIDTYWGGLPSHHIMGKDLDRIRAQPVQLAILDAGNHLDQLIASWK